LDQALKSVFGHAATTERSYPARGYSEPSLSEPERKHAAALMRINHAGEVCAQALYHGQGLASRNPSVRNKMQAAAIEEGDHLAWCSKRLTELSSHTSYLNPFWYAGSFAIGLTAGLIGDKWSLGFLAETEKQVVKHLENQMQLLPASDDKSQQILQQMRQDEAKHEDDAIAAGAAQLPLFIKKIMGLTSKLMVKTAYFI
jgi:ubiquinone biosynthesis monooxygenase Coq7